jgi:hypothetical protein
MEFSELQDDFLRITGEIVWCSVATVDTRGRPRTRVLHPCWEVVDGHPVGWVGTTRSPLKTRHLAANPYVSCSYWSPKHETASADCRAEWAPDQNERVWQLFLDAEPPMGYDPATMPPFKDGPAGGGFQALKLDPWRLAVLTAEDAAAGGFHGRVWEAA